MYITFQRKSKWVVLQSTLHKNEIIEPNIQINQKIIINYNKTKGAVDTLDKIVATYTAKKDDKPLAICLVLQYFRHGCIYFLGK